MYHKGRPKARNRTDDKEYGETNLKNELTPFCHNMEYTTQHTSLTSLQAVVGAARSFDHSFGAKKKETYIIVRNKDSVGGINVVPMSEQSYPPTTLLTIKYIIKVGVDWNIQFGMSSMEA